MENGGSIIPSQDPSLCAQLSVLSEGGSNTEMG